MRNTEVVKNYRIKLHDLGTGAQVAIPSYRIISYWEVDKVDDKPGHTLINIEGLDDPVIVSEPFEFVDKIVLRAFGWRIPTGGYKKEITLATAEVPAAPVSGVVSGLPVSEMEVQVTE